MRDLDVLFASLAKSRFRRSFSLGLRERTYLAAKGRQTVIDHARAFVAQRLAPALPINDGRQTPFRGHPVFVAQHATATCCRGCLAKWHRIAAGHLLTPEEQAHIVAAITRWLDAQEMQPCGAANGASRSGWHIASRQRLNAEINFKTAQTIGSWTPEVWSAL